nr:hypothetical protein [Hydrogenobacter thermophilus]
MKTSDTSQTRSGEKYRRNYNGDTKKKKVDTRQKCFLWVFSSVDGVVQP